MMLELAALIGQYGLLIIFALVLLEQLGLPLPGLPALVVAGALAAGGGLSLPALFGAAVLACLIGDAAGILRGLMVNVSCTRTAAPRPANSGITSMATNTVPSAIVTRSPTDSVYVRRWLPRGPMSSCTSCSPGIGL